jgi:hypothetical protein
LLKSGIPIERQDPMGLPLRSVPEVKEGEAIAGILTGNSKFNAVTADNWIYRVDRASPKQPHPIVRGRDRAQ